MVRHEDIEKDMCTVRDGGQGQRQGAHSEMERHREKWSGMVTN